MTIFKIKKRENPYIKLDKTSLNDVRLSFKAKGLHCLLMSYPENWQVKMAHLQTKSTDGRDSIRAGIDELIKHGYVCMHRPRDEQGRYRAIAYDVYEIPYKATEEANDQSGLGPKLTTNGKPESGNGLMILPRAENPKAEEPLPANLPLIINNINNKLLNKTITTEPNGAEDSNKQLQDKNSVVSVVRLKIVDEEKSIGKRLTKLQADLIKAEVQLICAGNTPLNQTGLVDEIAYALLDKKSFTRARNDFLLKLNAILKIIREGRWSTPSGMQEQIELAERQKQQKLNQEIRELAGEYDTLHMLLNHAKKIGDESLLSQHLAQINKVRNTLEKLIMKSKELDSENNYNNVGTGT